MKNVGIIKEAEGKWKYHLELPDKLAEWDVWDYWEHERFESLRQNLISGSILFDIGAEIGWTSALIAKYFCSNIVLVEPSVVFSPYTKQIWNSNDLKEPIAIYNGFAGSKNEGANSWGWVLSEVDPWGKPYKYLHKEEDKKEIPTITIDSLSEEVGLVPTAINIDIEGAELEALKGCVGLMEGKRKPLIWVSIHPDLLLRDYGHTKQELLDFMGEHGYKGELLATDHEEHHLFKPI